MSNLELSVSVMSFICSLVIFLQQDTAYEMRISDWSSDVCSSDLPYDTCLAPVLAMDESPNHHHNLARDTFVEHAGVLQPAPAPRFNRTPGRSAERRVGNECVSTCKSRWSPYREKKKTKLKSEQNIH